MTDTPKIKDHGEGVLAVELEAGAPLSPEKAAELADELGRRLAMAGVRDEERRIAEQAFAKALEGFDASNAAATVLPVAQRGLERALDSIGVLTDTLLGVAKLSPAGPNVFACGRAAQAIGTAIVLLEQALDIVKDLRGDTDETPKGEGTGNAS
jgi:hypothetical protein